MTRELLANAARTIRSVRSLGTLQIVARPVRMAMSKIITNVPSGHPPSVVGALSEPHDLWQRFADAERARYLERRPRLGQGSLLRDYEEQYGLEIGGTEFHNALPRWDGRIAVHPYPASVRARRLAVAVRLGRPGLERELTRACRAVLTQLEFHLMGNHLLENAMALACGGAVALGPEADLWWAVGSRLLAWQLDEQFLPDGGHFERSATYHAALVGGLLETVKLAECSGRFVPPTWRPIVERALQWLVNVRAPDGTYPLFNDAALDGAPRIDEVLELADAFGYRIRPEVADSYPCTCVYLRDTGWIVMSSPEAWVCFDVGPDGSPSQPGHVHADALTFELFIRGRRAVVDYGVSSYSVDDAREETRATHSHNTLELNGINSCEVWHAFRVGRRCNANLESLAASPDNIEFEAKHDGYAWLPGAPRHKRRVRFSSGSLIIADFLDGGDGEAVSSVRVAASAGNDVRVTGNSQVWSNPGVWHPNFAQPCEAVVYRQKLHVRRRQESRWELKWQTN